MCRSEGSLRGSAKQLGFPDPVEDVLPGLVLGPGFQRQFTVEAAGRGQETPVGESDAYADRRHG